MKKNIKRILLVGASASILCSVGAFANEGGKAFLKPLDNNTSKVIPLHMINGSLLNGARGVSDANEFPIVAITGGGCIFKGEAKPDFNTERFNIRLKTAVCDNSMVSYDIKGYVFGVDDLYGVEGILEENLLPKRINKQDYLPSSTEQRETRELKQKVMKAYSSRLMEIAPKTEVKIWLQEGTFMKIGAGEDAHSTIKADDASIIQLNLNDLTEEEFIVIIKSARNKAEINPTEENVKKFLMLEKLFEEKKERFQSIRNKLMSLEHK